MQGTGSGLGPQSPPALLSRLGFSLELCYATRILKDEERDKVRLINMSPKRQASWKRVQFWTGTSIPEIARFLC